MRVNETSKTGQIPNRLELALCANYMSICESRRCVAGPLNMPNEPNDPNMPNEPNIPNLPNEKATDRPSSFITLSNQHRTLPDKPSAHSFLHTPYSRGFLPNDATLFTESTVDFFILGNHTGLSTCPFQ